MSQARPSPIARGFSLIELVIVVVIVAITLTLASPAYSSFIASQRQRAAASALQTALLTARSEALKRNVTVSLAANDAGLSGGWAVRLPNSAVLQSQEAFSGLTFSPAAASFTYNYYGRLATTVSPAGTIVISSPQGGTCWRVIVDVSGKASVASGCA